MPVAGDASRAAGCHEVDHDLLRKLGTVVNVAGLSPGETASTLRSYSPAGVLAHRDEDIVFLSLVAAELGLDYHTPRGGPAPC